MIWFMTQTAVQTAYNCVYRVSLVRVWVCVSLLFFVYFHFFIALRKIFVHRNINVSYEMTTHFTFKLFREVESASRIFSVCVNRTQWSHNICTMAKIHRNFNSTKNTTAVERRQRQENGKQQKNRINKTDASGERKNFPVCFLFYFSVWLQHFSYINAYTNTH